MLLLTLAFRKGNMCTGNEHIYDGFEYLRRALFWEPDRPITMLTFYADDSGKKADHEYLVVAAYVGLAAQWETFSVDWRLRLAKAGLTWFHASDFFHGTDEFSGWNSKERAGERKNLLSDLVQIIGKATLQSFLCHVHVPAYDQLNAEFMLKERNVTPFSLCARTIVGQARNWWRERGGDYKNIKYVFDRGCEDWGLLMKRLETDHGVIPIPENKREIRPIQASDWLA